jgi:hypothetical protein
MLPVFAGQINQWADGLCKNPTRPVVENGVCVQDIVAACKALSLRSIAMSIYGNAFDESVRGWGQPACVSQTKPIFDKRNTALSLL